MDLKRIAVLSDTHIPGRLERLPEPLLEAFRGMDGILHLGDFTQPAVLEALQAVAPVEAVRGNCDAGDLRRRLPERRVVEVAGRRIGMTHGSGPRHGLELRVRRRFEPGEVDLVLFGHSHSFYDGTVSGIRMINPGSAGDPELGTYVVLSFGETIECELREVESEA